MNSFGPGHSPPTVEPGQSLSHIQAPAEHVGLDQHLMSAASAGQAPSMVVPPDAEQSDVETQTPRSLMRLHDLKEGSILVGLTFSAVSVAGLVFGCETYCNQSCETQDFEMHCEPGGLERLLAWKSVQKRTDSAPWPPFVPTTKITSHSFECFIGRCSRQGHKDYHTHFSDALNLRPPRLWTECVSPHFSSQAEKIS